MYPRGTCLMISTAGVHQMRLLRRRSFIIIIILVVVIVGHLKSLRPQKPRFSSIENKTERTDGRTNGRTDGQGVSRSRIQKLSPTNPINITNKSKKITNKSSSFPSTKKNKFRKSNKFCPLNQKKSLSSSSSHCSYHSIIYIRARGRRGECLFITVGNSTSENFPVVRKSKKSKKLCQLIQKIF